MAENEKDTKKAEEQPVVAAAADVPVPAVTAQEAKKVGDDEVYADVHEVKPEVVREDVAAQVAQPREGDADKVHVHEVSVQMDRVVTDPSSPEAVQVPDAGRSPLLSGGLPIARLDADRVEDVFAREGK